MFVLVGLTGEVTSVVSALLVYQVTVPLLHVADKAELCPEQIVMGLAEILVGADGIGFTVIEIFPGVLLQPNALTHDT